MPDYEQNISCLNVSIPQTDDTLDECGAFMFSKCIVEGNLTQEEINTNLNTKVDDLILRLNSLQSDYNQNASTNNTVILSNLGITANIVNSFNTQPQLVVNKNNILIVKATVSGNANTYIFARGKGVYGTGGTQITSADLIQI